MSLITRMRKGVCVHWARSARDGYAQWTFSDPVEIDVRWEDVNELHENQNGEKWMSSTTVYVGIDINTGDWVFNGRLIDLTDVTTPQRNNGAREIRKFSKLPTLRYNEFMRTAYL